VVLRWGRQRFHRHEVKEKEGRKVPCKKKKETKNASVWHPQKNKARSQQTKVWKV
jgi:hypothetical protein